MGKTNLSFVSPSRLIYAVMLLLVMSFGVSYASAQCTPPTNLTVTPECDGSLTINWDAVATATSYTLDVENNNGFPVVNFVNVTTTSVTITSGTLTPSTAYPFTVTANCDVSSTASTPGTIQATDVYDLPPTIAISNVVNPSCPTSTDGSFDVTVNDACGANYDISVGAITFFNVPAGGTVSFGSLTGSVVGTDYIVNLALAVAGGCNYDPACIAGVSATQVLTSADVTPPGLQLFNASGAQIPDGSSFTYSAPEGECGVLLVSAVFSSDNCGVPTITASVSNPNPQVIPTAYLVLLNNTPVWALEIFVPVGTNTVTVTSTDANGNATTQSFTIEVPDERLPEIYGPGDINIEIPPCEDDIPINWTVVTVDDCDSDPALVQTTGPASGTFLTPGLYTVTHTSTDDYGNTATESFDINVTQAPSPPPIIDISENDGPFNASECENDILVTVSGIVIDCDLTPFNINPSDITIATIPTSPDASGMLTISYTLPEFGYVYFEATGNLTPGTYTATATYEGVSVDHNLIVTKEIDQEAPQAMCKDITITLDHEGLATLTASQIDNGSSDECGIASMTIDGNTALSCDDIGSMIVRLTVTDPSGNTASCQSLVTVNEKNDFPDGWKHKDIGFVPIDNEYTYDACSAIPVFSVVGSGNNTIASNKDNVAFLYQNLCGDGSITAKIESITPNGYGGLMIRETTDDDSKQVSIFSNLTNILRHETRYFSNSNKVVQSFFKPLSYWLRLERQGNWVFAFNSFDGVNFQYVHAVYIPIQDCVEIGMASFTYLPNEQTEAVFSNVEITSSNGALGQTGDFLEVPSVNVIREIDNLSVYPNPSQGQFRIQFEEHLNEEVNLKIFNAFGQLIQQKVISSGAISVECDLQDAPQGAYMLHLEGSGIVKTQNILISR